MSKARGEVRGGGRGAAFVYFWFACVRGWEGGGRCAFPGAGGQGHFVIISRYNGIHYNGLRHT